MTGGWREDILKTDHVDILSSDDKPGDKIELLQVYGFVDIFNSSEVIHV